MEHPVDGAQQTMASELHPFERRSDRPPSDVSSASVALQSLDAQAALLPYALIFFAVALPIFAWACSYAADRFWMTASFAVFALNWAAFYAVVDWMKRHPASRTDVHLRTRVHVLGGLLWAAAVAQVSALALGAGGAKESILLLAAGAAAVCTFFSAPSLPSLLIVSPAACAAPLMALYADAPSRPTGRLVLAGFALAMALSLILNRLLRQLSALAGEREQLIADRANSLDRAQTLAKSKSDLVATLSSEILNGLTGVTHVLAAAVGGGGRSAPSRDQLTAALASAQDLTAVLNATLDTELAQAGRLVIERKPFDVARLARELVLLHRPQAAAKGLEIAFHVDDAMAAEAAGAVPGDAARTRQILANLIGNAVKYTLRGRVEVRVERLGADHVRVEVADTGPGLSVEELERAFHPFTRIGRTGAGVPGAGLGLSLSRQLALMMGGDVQAESALGVGSCFRLELPFDPAGALERTGASADDPPMAGGGERGMRVLIAEDDPLSAAMLRSALEQLGHQVVQVRDGRRAFDLAQLCDIDLYLLGVQLPQMDGPETTRAIRGLAGDAGRTPIIAIVSGEAEEADACLDAGADEVLRKPVNVSNLARAMAAVTQTPRRGRPASNVAA